jgi:hypothetical protein
MVDPDLLYTIAQVGVTYAGFSTLVTVVAYRRDMKALPWRASSGLFGAAWCAYWINAIVILKTRFRVWDSLALLNKVNTVLVHPTAFILLLVGMTGFWGESVEAVYVTALFIMLYMSAYLFLQIIIDLLDTQSES